VNGLRYGNFNHEINLELVKINRVLVIIKSGMNDRQLSAYTEYKIELQVLLLQALYQQQPDIIFSILNQLTGLNAKELRDISDKITEIHAREFPAFQMRR
jgi:hypothetical protein